MVKARRLLGIGCVLHETSLLFRRTERVWKYVVTIAW